MRLPDAIEAAGGFVKRTTAVMRIKKYGWTVEDAVEKLPAAKR
jgi:hypothetical protein